MNIGQVDDYIIYLCHKPEHWCQMIYQLSHELGHFFMDCCPERQNLKWIDECLCELFSLIFLRRSTLYFETFLPPYVESVNSYISDYIQRAKSYSILSCSDLITQKIGELENDPTEDGVKGRPRNSYIATKLYGILGCDGKGLSAVCLFPALTEATTSNRFFELWLQNCRVDDERYFVNVVKEQVGI